METIKSVHENVGQGCKVHGTARDEPCEKKHKKNVGKTKQGHRKISVGVCVTRLLRLPALVVMLFPMFVRHYPQQSHERNTSAPLVQACKCLRAVFSSVLWNAVPKQGTERQ